MRKLALALATSAAIIATPALARDGAAYGGLEFGAMKASDQDIDVNNVDDVIVLEHEFDFPDDAGYDGAAFIGYDFGAFRLEGEVSYKKARLDEITSAIILPGGAAAGSRVAGGGSVSSLSGMLNAMADFGDDDGISAFVGAGAGWARVGGNDLRAFANGPNFIDDKDSGFAWQLFAGLRQAISDNADIHVKYRFFNVPNVDWTDGVNAYETDFQSHSLLGGITFNFGGAEPAPPPPPPVRTAPPPPPPPPPPAPQTRTCPNGQVLPVTTPCPAPPPPQVPPTGERG